jgi:1,4-alpha-glucan branching enzyme
MARSKWIEFKLDAPQAQTVGVAGGFNNWDAAKTPMRKGGSGTWFARVSLVSGRHEYRFVVDGNWISDPNAKESVPNPHGGVNSVVVV